MAAPVFQDGDPIGSLVVASYDKDRRYGGAEQEVLLAFAEHASGPGPAGPGPDNRERDRAPAAPFPFRHGLIQVDAAGA